MPQIWYSERQGRLLRPHRRVYFRTPGSSGRGCLLYCPRRHAPRVVREGRYRVWWLTIDLNTIYKIWLRKSYWNNVLWWTLRTSDQVLLRVYIHVAVIPCSLLVLSILFWVTGWFQHHLPSRYQRPLLYGILYSLRKLSNSNTTSWPFHVFALAPAINLYHVGRVREPVMWQRRWLCLLFLDHALLWIGNR